VTTSRVASTFGDDASILANEVLFILIDCQLCNYSTLVKKKHLNLPMREVSFLTFMYYFVDSLNVKGLNVRFGTPK